jgi:hypothetical protein
MEINPKSEYRNSKQIQIFKILMIKTYGYGLRVKLFGALEFRICFVLRASDFEFEIHLVLYSILFAYWILAT